MKKVLIQQNKLFHYRKEFLNQLGKRYFVTVIHSGELTCNKDDNYDEIIIKKFKIGSLVFQPKIFFESFKNYDALVLMFNFNYIINLLLLLIVNKQKIILWGPWFTNNALLNSIRIKILKNGFKTIFYSKKHKKDFEIKGVNSEYLFVANNTYGLKVRNKSYRFEKFKNSIIFVGSFDFRKNIDILIESFIKILPEIPENINLILVGEGERYTEMISLVKKLSNETNRIEFKGKITDPLILSEIYKTALISVSPGQAGLSVLQSFGYGVPFMTTKGAISGGEKFNIQHKKNGFLLENDVDEFAKYLKILANNAELACEMGKNAFNYYSHNCTIETMVTGFQVAIEKKRSK